MTKSENLLIEIFDAKNPTDKLASKYRDTQHRNELDALVSELENGGFIKVKYADNKPYIVYVTNRGLKKGEELKLTPRGQLLALIEREEDVEKEVNDKTHSFENFSYLTGKLFTEWTNDLKIYTERYLSSHPLYNDIKESIRLRKRDDNSFNDLCSYIESVFRDEVFWKEKDLHMENAEGKKKIIFISHSNEDYEYVKTFVNLLEDMGCQKGDIICSSVPTYAIPLGNNIYEWLVEKFQKCDLHVIYLLSHNYYMSAACLNEMGAAWAMKHTYTPILLPGFDFKEIEGCIDKLDIAIKLDAPDEYELKSRLKELSDTIINELNLNPMDSIRWEEKRDIFINKIKSICNSD